MRYVGFIDLVLFWPYWPLKGQYEGHSKIFRTTALFSGQKQQLQDKHDWCFTKIMFEK